MARKVKKSALNVDQLTKKNEINQKVFKLIETYQDATNDLIYSLRDAGNGFALARNVSANFNSVDIVKMVKDNPGLLQSKVVCELLYKEAYELKQQEWRTYIVLPEKCTNGDEKISKIFEAAKSFWDRVSSSRSYHGEYDYGIKARLLANSKSIDQIINLVDVLSKYEALLAMDKRDEEATNAKSNNLGILKKAINAVYSAVMRNDWFDAKKAHDPVPTKATQQEWWTWIGSLVSKPKAESNAEQEESQNSNAVSTNVVSITDESFENSIHREFQNHADALVRTAKAACFSAAISENQNYSMCLAGSNAKGGVAACEAQKAKFNMLVKFCNEVFSMETSLDAKIEEMLIDAQNIKYDTETNMLQVSDKGVLFDIAIDSLRVDGYLPAIASGSQPIYEDLIGQQCADGNCLAAGK